MQGLHPTGFLSQGDYNALRHFVLAIAEKQVEGGPRLGAGAGPKVASDVFVEGVEVFSVLTAVFQIPDISTEGIKIGSSIELRVDEVAVEGQKIGAVVEPFLAEHILLEPTEFSVSYFIVPLGPVLEAEGEKMSAVLVPVIPEGVYTEGVVISPIYNIEGVPELIATRLSDAEFLLDIGNLDARDIFFQKKPDEISAWADLDTYPPGSIPVTINIASDKNPKVKAAFSVAGNIDGEPVSFRGRLSMPNSVRKNG